MIRTALLLAALPFAAMAQIPQPTDAPKPRTPEESAAAFKLPEGFRMEVVASEPLIASPSAVCWDERGRSDQKFVSKSGRIVITTEDWNASYSLALAGIKPVPEQFTVKWSVVPWFADEFVSPGVKDPALETAVTLAQGLPNTKHTLEISGGPDTPIAALRIYRPEHF